MSQLRLWTKHRPADERENRTNDHRRHKVSSHHVDQLLNWGAASLSVGNHLHDTVQNRVTANTDGFHHERTGLVQRSARDFVTFHLLHRHRLARQHRLVDAARPAENFPIDRNFLARTYSQPIALVD